VWFGGGVLVGVVVLFLCVGGGGGGCGGEKKLNLSIAFHLADLVEKTLKPPSGQGKTSLSKE